VTRVGIAGRDGMLRRGLEALIGAHQDFQLSAVAESIEDIPAHSSDVVVALENGPDPVPATPPLVLIWPTVDAAQLRMAWRAGVRAVLPADCSSAELIAAIEAAAVGLIAFRAQDMDGLPVEVRATEPIPLSSREIEVLRLVADGLANKEISFRLGISEHTVKFHINSILTRMNAATRAEAVAIGMRQGLILL
jgi:two-component system, NarL family, response regulator YdfI